jgi:hypothetical protein
VAGAHLTPRSATEEAITDTKNNVILTATDAPGCIVSLGEVSATRSPKS